MNRSGVITLACFAVVGGMVVTLAAELWNGIIKTDTESLLKPRDVNQSRVIPAPEPTFGGLIAKDAYKVDGLVAAVDSCEKGLAQYPAGPN